MNIQMAETSLRDRSIYLNIGFIYAAVFLLILTTDRMFIELTKIQTSRMVISLCLVGSFVFFGIFTSFMRKWFIFLCIYLIACMLESYYLYNHPVKYAHVFMKIMIYFMIFFAYGFHKMFDKVTLVHIMIISFVMFAINVATVNKAALSLSAFTNHERGVGITSVYILVLIFLYSFHQYFNTRKAFYMFLFFIIFGALIFFQHRTVWVAMMLSLVVSIFLMRFTLYKIDLNSLVPVGIFVVYMGILLSMVVFSDEEIMHKLEANVHQIMNPLDKREDGSASTSEWRYIQFQSYWPFIEQHPIFGMRLAGFELPVQFYNHVGKNVFEDNTGHHFHSAYIDKLFYQGIIGLLLFLLPPIIYVVRCIQKQPYLTVEQVVFVSFIASGIFYGFSYNYPDYFYGVMGIALFKIEKLNPPIPPKSSSISNTNTHKEDKIQKEISAKI